MDRAIPPYRLLLPALACLIAVIGCAHYRVGARSLFPADVATVYVPIFESESFRRNLGERLTEAVVKEIERQTPYKVVNSPDADSVLSGVIVSETKSVLIQAITDEPRELQTNFRVRVNWVNRRGDLIREQEIALAPELIDVDQVTAFVPEGGQSLATAHQRAFQKMAKQIVSMMESPW